MPSPSSPPLLLLSSSLLLFLGKFSRLNYSLLDTNLMAFFLLLCLYQTHHTVRLHFIQASSKTNNNLSIDYTDDSHNSLGIITHAHHHLCFPLPFVSTNFASLSTILYNKSFIHEFDPTRIRLRRKHYEIIKLHRSHFNTDAAERERNNVWECNKFDWSIIFIQLDIIAILFENFEHLLSFSEVVYACAHSWASCIRVKFYLWVS